MVQRMPKTMSARPLVQGKAAVATAASGGHEAGSGARPTAGVSARPRIGFGSLAVHPPGYARDGLPAQLKTGIEALSGISLDGVSVRYGSPVPARLGAHAFARGREIHIAAGQEHHLPHEAWHLVQQAQGRVRPTLKLDGGVSANDDRKLEREADAMGARALAAGRRAAPADTSGSAPGRGGRELPSGTGAGAGVTDEDAARRGRQS